jgi:metal-responsive CopG/Arc/MetJ family transcriptional regulator
MITPMMNARVDAVTVAELDTIAAERGVTRSDLIRQAIAQLIEDNATGKWKER